MTILTLVLSLGVITLGAEALVRGASLLALRAGLSPLFVGLTVVALGTSTPELGASLAATLRGKIDVSVGNVVGSNIFNIGVIIGVTALIRPIRVRLAAVRRDLLVAIAAAALPWMSVVFGGVFPRWLGLVSVALLVVYIGWGYRSGRRAKAEELTLAQAEIQSTLAVAVEVRHFWDRTWTAILLVATGIGLLAVGSRIFVDAAIELAHALEVTELVIGLTLVSAGTSLPELVTSVVAVARRNADIAVGNIIGSNIFNVFGILGACAIVRPQTVSRWVLVVDVPVLFVATLALLPIMKSGGSVSRVEGGVLLFGYALYLGFLLIRGG